MTKHKHFPKGREWDDEDTREDIDIPDPNLHRIGDSIRDSTNPNRTDRTGKYTKKFR